MGILNSVGRLWALALLVFLGLLALLSAGGVALASDNEGDVRGEGENAVREQYCEAATGDNPVDCGSFCFWAMCVECPQCCPCGDDACSDSNQHCVSSQGPMTCSDQVCIKDNEGNEDCSCRDCGAAVDCTLGCCTWRWRMYGQNENINSMNGYSVSFGEYAENVRLDPVIALAVSEPTEIQDCLSDLSNRNESIEEDEGTVPTATVLWTPEWYGTRVPVGKPRRLPATLALHTYAGDPGAPVLDGVDQVGDPCEVVLLTSADWSELEFRMWPYDGRVPSDVLPGVHDPGRQHSGEDLNNPFKPSGGDGSVVDDQSLAARFLPQSSQMVQWTPVPPDGLLCSPSLRFIYEMFDWDDSGASLDWNTKHDERLPAQLYNPPVRIGNDGSEYPGSQGVVQRNYYDWAVYTFQLRWKDPERANLTSNTVNAMLHLNVEGGTNPCPEEGPASTICGFRIKEPENTTLTPWGTFGAHALPAVMPAQSENAGFVGVHYNPWLRPAAEWFYSHTARIGIYASDARLHRLANAWRDTYRVVSPEVRPSLSVSIVEDPVTELEDVELTIGQLEGDLADGWVDMRFWPHTGTDSAQSIDHKWYSLGDVQGETVRLGRDFGCILRCWQYRSDNFADGACCGVDEDAGEQRTDSLMDFTNPEYEVFRHWRTWNIQIRVLDAHMTPGGQPEYFHASSPSLVSLAKLGDPVPQEVDRSVSYPLPDSLLPGADRPHSEYACSHGSAQMSNQLVNRHGDITNPKVFEGDYDCQPVLLMEPWFDVDLDHHGAASADSGADDPDTPGWRYLDELGGWGLP